MSKSIKKTRSLKKTRRSYTYAQKINILNRFKESGDSLLAFSKKLIYPKNIKQLEQK